MATKTLMDQFIAFAAPKENTPVSRDAVSVFYSKIDRQVALAEQAKAGEKVSARVTWFKRDGSAYRVKIGREALKFGDHRWFSAASLDEVIKRLKMAREVIATSDTLKQQIVRNSNARSERMQGSRKAKKAA